MQHFLCHSKLFSESEVKYLFILIFVFISDEGSSMLSYAQPQLLGMSV